MARDEWIKLKLAGYSGAMVMDALKCFKVYGLDIYVPESLAQILEAAEELHRNLNAANDGKTIYVEHD